MGNNMMGSMPANNSRRMPAQQYPRRAPETAKPCPDSACRCDELMCALMEASFYAQDLKLYLDTHPDDSRAVEMYVEACRQYKACKAAFEENCYPLTPCSAGLNGSWNWPEGIWPPKN